ncbi:hypothetical protein J6590_100035 [Homalodisca vitripennis]|nr:hypothetical protein J6590_100035 [Homalodisca vitripennis]
MNNRQQQCSIHCSWLPVIDSKLDHVATDRHFGLYIGTFDRFPYGKSANATLKNSATPYVTRPLTQIPCQQCYTVCNKAADPDTASAVLMLRQHLLADCSTINTVLLLSD